MLLPMQPLPGQKPHAWDQALWSYNCHVRPYANRVFAVRAQLLPSLAPHLSLKPKNLVCGNALRQFCLRCCKQVAAMQLYLCLHTLPV
jgi:hypothetical protein